MVYLGLSGEVLQGSLTYILPIHMGRDSHSLQPHLTLSILQSLC